MTGTATTSYIFLPLLPPCSEFSWSCGGRSLHTVPRTARVSSAQAGEEEAVTLSSPASPATKATLSPSLLLNLLHKWVRIRKGELWFQSPQNFGDKDLCTRIQLQVSRTETETPKNKHPGINWRLRKCSQRHYFGEATKRHTKARPKIWTAKPKSSPITQKRIKNTSCETTVSSARCKYRNAKSHANIPMRIMPLQVLLREKKMLPLQHGRVSVLEPKLNWHRSLGDEMCNQRS